MKIYQKIYRAIYYILGLTILALGLALNAKTGLGVSPITSLPYTVAEILQITDQFRQYGLSLLLNFYYHRTGSGETSIGADFDYFADSTKHRVYAGNESIRRSFYPVCRNTLAADASPAVRNSLYGSWRGIDNEYAPCTQSGRRGCPVDF